MFRNYKNHELTSRKTSLKGHTVTNYKDMTLLSVLQLGNTGYQDKLCFKVLSIKIPFSIAQTGVLYHANTPSEASMSVSMLMLMANGLGAGTVQPL
jgi:hypothetical protein